MRKITILNILAILAFLVILAAYLLYFRQEKTIYLSIELTDPTYAPLNTEHINVSYVLQVQLETFNKTGPGTVDSFIEGIADLAKLQGSGSTVAKLRIPWNSSINSIIMNIIGSNITINGTSYPLQPPGGLQLTTAPNKLLNSSYTELISISPAILTIFSQNSTVFQMEASLNSALINGAGNASEKPSQISRSAMAELAASVPAVTMTSASISSESNITHISVTLSDNSNSAVDMKYLLIYGNESSYLYLKEDSAEAQPSFDNITATDLLNGTFSTIANALATLENESATVIASNSLTKLNASGIAGNAISAFNKSSGSSSAYSGLLSQLANEILGYLGAGAASNTLSNASIPEAGSLSQLNLSERASVVERIIANLTNSSYASSLSGKNLSVLESVLRSKLGSATLSATNITAILGLLEEAQSENQAQYAVEAMGQQHQLGVLDFVILNSSLLSLPTSTVNAQNAWYGYLMQPGQSETFSFNGTMLLAGGRLALDMVKGDNYTIEAYGENGASASLNVTAG